MDKSSLLFIFVWTTLSLSANGATIIKTSHLTSNIDMHMNVVDDNGFETNPKDMDAIDVYKTSNNNGDELSKVESVSYICDLQHISIVSGHTSITLPLNTFINKLSSLTLSKTESVNSNEINQNPISPSDPINMAPCKIHGTNTLRRYTFYIAIMVIIFGLSIKNTKINLIMNPNFKTMVINMCLLCSLDCVLGRTAVFRFPTEDPTKLSLNPTIDPTTNPTSLNSNAPTIATFEMLECPQNSTQIGDINADIRGCGLESCDNRYNITSIQECYNKCNSYSNCLSFSWSPYGGDRSHLNYKVCTLYDTTTAKGTWGPNQILCAMAPTPTTNPSSDPTKDPTIHPTMDPADDPRKYSRGPNTVDSWADAESYCQSLNTTLASIPTQDDWIEANKTCGDNFCWIGLKDDVSEGEWYWTDGTDITTSYGFNADGTATKGQEPWTNREPNNSGNEDCGQLYENGLYNDRWCTSSGLYPLCGIDPTPTPIPTNKPTSAPTTDPTNDPTLYPTVDPTVDPTIDPTSDPTEDPTSDPTAHPTSDPTADPTFDPTADPTADPTSDPTADPTNDPTFDPTRNPSRRPTSYPSTKLCRSKRLDAVILVDTDGQYLNNDGNPKFQQCLQQQNAVSDVLTRIKGEEVVPSGKVSKSRVGVIEFNKNGVRKIKSLYDKEVNGGIVGNDVTPKEMIDYMLLIDERCYDIVGGKVTDTTAKLNALTGDPIRACNDNSPTQLYQALKYVRDNVFDKDPLNIERDRFIIIFNNCRVPNNEIEKICQEFEDYIRTGSKSPLRGDNQAGDGINVIILNQGKDGGFTNTKGQDYILCLTEYDENRIGSRQSRDISQFSQISDPTVTETVCGEPTPSPTTDPTSDPTTDPTNDPTADPTNDPTSDPTNQPTTDPTKDPTKDPTTDPTDIPTNYPTADPTIDPTNNPTLDGCDFDIDTYLDECYCQSSSSSDNFYSAKIVEEVQIVDELMVFENDFEQFKNEITTITQNNNDMLNDLKTNQTIIFVLFGLFMFLVICINICFWYLWIRKQPSGKALKYKLSSQISSNKNGLKRVSCEDDDDEQSDLEMIETRTNA